MDLVKQQINTIEIENDSYSFVRISKHQIDELTDLFNSARDRKLDYSFFQKKYDTAWTGKENIAIIIQSTNGELLGHLGVLPEFVKHGNSKYLSGQISDAVLAPGLRGKNVFEILINKLAILSKEEGLDFLYVTPSPQAIKGFEKNEWIETNHICTYSIKLKTVPLNKVSNKLGLFKPYHLFVRTFIRLGSKKVKSFDNPNFHLNKGGIIISEEQVNHKNYTRNYLIKKNGFTFWFKIEDGMEIGNFEYFPKNQKTDFINVISKLARTLGCHQIKIVTTKGTFQDQIFSEYQMTVGNKVYFKELNTNIDFKEILFNGSDFNTF